MTSDSFTTASRLLDSGGDHVFFAGTDSIKLSTGRPDGGGGDGRQASHWKDKEINNGVYIGIMDPTADFGEVETITAADLEALETWAWTIAPPVRVDAVTGLLDGNTLQLAGTATARSKSLASAQLTLLDGAGATVAALPAQSLSLSGSLNFDFTLQFAGLGAYPTATQADLVVFDNAGVQSDAFRVSFGAAEAGAPTIASASFAKNQAKLSGAGFTAQTQLEVNGAIVTPPLTAKPNGKGTKLKVKGRRARSASSPVPTESACSSAGSGLISSFSTTEQMVGGSSTPKGVRQ